MKYLDIRRLDPDSMSERLVGRVLLLDDGAIRIEGEELQDVLTDGARDLDDLSAPLRTPKDGEAFLRAVASQMDNPMTYQAQDIVEAAVPPPPSAS